MDPVQSKTKQRSTFIELLILSSVLSMAYSRNLVALALKESGSEPYDSLTARKCAALVFMPVSGQGESSTSST